MFKKILTSALTLLLTLSAFSVFSFAEGTPSLQPNRDNYAYEVNGGQVKTEEEFISAFTDENGRAHISKINGKPTSYVLTDDVKLKAPIIINGGTFTLQGGNCTIYRGIAYEPLIVLNGIGDGNPPTLTLKQDITLDGLCDKIDSEQGLIQVFGASFFEAEDVTFVNTCSKTQVGGAICIKSTQTNDVQNTPLSPMVTIKDCLFENCVSISGGAIGMTMTDSYSTAELKVTGCVFNNNSVNGGESYAYGGAIFSESGSIEIDSCTFTGNKADFGGAIYTKMSLKITDCSFEYNSSTEDGAAVHCQRAELADCKFLYNSATGNGGAIAGKGDVLLENIYATENKAESNGGFAYFNGKMTVNGGNIYLNKAEKMGGAFYIYGIDASLHIKSGGIVSNKAPLCASVFCNGEAVFEGGSIGNSVGEFPQIFIGKAVTIGEDATIKNDVLALGVSDDKSVMYPCILLDGVLKTEETLNFAYVRCLWNDNDDIYGFKNVTRGKETVLLGDIQAIEKASEIIKLKSRGLLSYKVDENGMSLVRFIFLPIWAWVVIGVTVCGSAVAIFIVKKGKSQKPVAKKTKK